mmetsp:Transcript_27656/g.79452  ORF Transcript_27656/g.79452 Transcript_27656/m.79452 type:complete len:95 (+) Transcript_27656:107-391(+)
MHVELASPAWNAWCFLCAHNALHYTISMGKLLCPCEQKNAAVTWWRQKLIMDMMSIPQDHHFAVRRPRLRSKPSLARGCNHLLYFFMETTLSIE